MNTCIHIIYTKNMYVYIYIYVCVLHRYMKLYIHRYNEVRVHVYAWLCWELGDLGDQPHLKEAEQSYY